MRFKKLYIYIILICVFVVVIRENLDFIQGDRYKYFIPNNFLTTKLVWRNVITNNFFSTTTYAGEILLSIFYYRNVFILSDLILKITPLKERISAKFLKYAIIIALLGPISIIFTSFAGKDIIAIALTSVLCINILKIIERKNLKLLDAFYLFILLIFIFRFRDLAGYFSLILLFSFIYYYTNLINQKMFLLFTTIFFIFIFTNFENLYSGLSWRFALAIPPCKGGCTFTTINPLFVREVYFQNFYQGFLGINFIHLNDSFIKSIAIIYNHLSSYLIGIFCNFIYWLKDPRLSIFFIIKISFFIFYFSIFAFLSQANAAAAVRFFSSVLPILVTFIFIINPISNNKSIN